MCEISKSERERERETLASKRLVWLWQGWWWSWKYLDKRWIYGESKRSTVETGTGEGRS